MDINEKLGALRRYEESFTDEPVGVVATDSFNLWISNEKDLYDIVWAIGTLNRDRVHVIQQVRRLLVIVGATPYLLTRWRKFMQSYGPFPPFGTSMLLARVNPEVVADLIINTICEGVHRERTSGEV